MRIVLMNNNLRIRSFWTDNGVLSHCSVPGSESFLPGLSFLPHSRTLDKLSPQCLHAIREICTGVHSMLGVPGDNPVLCAG